MTNRFRPTLNALEARDVPAAFSFALPDGTVGQGTFSTPAGVDPAQSPQIINLTDLTVSLGGQKLSVGLIASATYSYGVLLGVTASATGSNVQVDLGGTTATVGSASAPIAYDAASTATTFTLSDGTVGAISFRMPWESVNATLATQSLSLQNFNLNLAGRNFTTSDVTVNATPTAHFVYGKVVGVTFDLGLSTVGFPYSAVSMAQDIVTATGAGFTVQGDANYQLANAASKPSTGLGLTFAAPTENYHYELTIDYNGKPYKITADIQAGSSAEVVRDTIFNALNTKLAGSGLTVSKSGTTGITIQAPADKSFKWGDESSQMIDGKKKLYSGGPTITVTFADA